MNREQLNTDLLINIAASIHLNTIGVIASLPRDRTTEALSRKLDELIDNVAKLSDVSTKLDAEENNA